MLPLLHQTCLYNFKICVEITAAVVSRGDLAACCPAMMVLRLVQGLVLDCSSLAWEPMDAFPPAQEAAASSTKLPIWLALDEIEDPVTALHHLA